MIFLSTQVTCDRKILRLPVYPIEGIGSDDLFYVDHNVESDLLAQLPEDFPKVFVPSESQYFESLMETGGLKEPLESSSPWTIPDVQYDAVTGDYFIPWPVLVICRV